MAIKSGGMGNDRKDVTDAIQEAVNLLTGLLPSGVDTWAAERANAKRCFSIFEKTVGHIDLTAPSCGSPDDVKVRIGLSLAKKEIVPGLDGTPSGAALSAIFEEWDSSRRKNLKQADGRASQPFPSGNPSRSCAFHAIEISFDHQTCRCGRHGDFPCWRAREKGTATCTPYLLQARRPQIACSFPIIFPVISLRFYLLSAIEIL